MISKVLKLFACFILFASYSYAQLWNNLTTPSTNTIYGVFPINNDTVIAVGGNIGASYFMKTTNGGTSWSEITNEQTQWLYDVKFINDSVGVTVGYNGAIYKTEDAGNTWQAKPSETIKWLYALDYLTEDTIIAVGQDGKIIKSINAGNNWSNKISNTTQTLFDVDFVDHKYGVAVGDNGEIMYSSDAGENWALKLQILSLYAQTSVFMLSKDTFFTVGFLGRILKTTNGGATFTLVNSGTSENLNAIHFINHSIGFCTGVGVNLITIDGGNNWNLMNYPTTQFMKDIYFSPSGAVGYESGDNGTVNKLINTIGLEEQIINDLVLYPNPTADIIFFSDELIGENIVIYNLSGNIVYNQILINNSLNLSSLSNGVYMVKIAESKTKIIIQK